MTISASNATQHVVSPSHTNPVSSAKYVFSQMIKHVKNVSFGMFQRSTSGPRSGGSTKGGAQIRGSAKPIRTGPSSLNLSDDLSSLIASDNEEMQASASSTEELNACATTPLGESNPQLGLDDYAANFTQQRHDFLLAKAADFGVDTKKFTHPNIHPAVKEGLSQLATTFYVGHRALAKNPSDKASKELDGIMRDIFKLVNKHELDHKSILNGYQQSRQSDSKELMQLKQKLFEKTQNIHGDNISSTGEYLIKNEIEPFILSYCEQQLGSQLVGESKIKFLELIDNQALQYFNTLRKSVAEYKTAEIENIARDVEIVLTLPQLLRDFVDGMLKPQQPAAENTPPSDAIATPRQPQRVDVPSRPANDGRPDNTEPQPQQPVINNINNIHNDNRQYDNRHYDNSFSFIDNSIVVSGNNSTAKGNEPKTGPTISTQTEPAAISVTATPLPNGMDTEPALTTLNTRGVDGSSQTLPPPSNIVWMKKLTGTRVVESTLPTAVPHSASMTTVAAPAKGRTTVKLSNQGLRTANHPQNMPSYDHYGNKINQGSIDPVATSLDSQPSKQAASHASSVPSASPPSAATGNGQASTESDPKPVVLTRGGQQIFNVPKSRPAFDYRGQKIAYDQAGSNGDKTEFEQVHRNLTQLGQEQQKSPSLAQRNQAQQSPSFNRLAATLDAGETESASFAFQDASALSVTSPTVRTAQKMTRSLTPLTGSTHGIISEKNSLTSVDAPAKTGPGSQPSEPAASRATDNDQAGDPRPVVLTRGGQQIFNVPKSRPAFDYRGQKIAYDQAGSNGDKTEFEQVHRNLTQLGQEQQKSPSLAQRNQAQQSPSFNRLAATLDAGETESASFAFQDASALSVTSPTVRTAQKMTRSLTPLTGSTHGIISEKNSLTSVDAPAKTGPGSQPSEPAASRATAVPLQSPPSDATDNGQAKVSGDPRPVVLTRGGQRIPNEPKGFPQHINWFMDKRFDKKGR